MSEQQCTGQVEVSFDFYYIHEDMAGKGGPLMGPDLFRKFILPHYNELCSWIRTAITTY